MLRHLGAKGADAMAMTFDEIWDQLKKKQPLLGKDDSTVEFRPRNLKLLLRQIYDQGKASGTKTDPLGLGGLFK
jgi:hypothetical protein